ncbi:uncharacterized protein Tco025E_09276 [Trypanosoma conorhini]|uniref:Uncharacterized protein n=1 Tax=Trypanosoma conorhini TaxID=83891 RepID=A0A422MYE1_9TRYP|nr:uncharacterized protein Tco025E_09276 [Trypanosoma conorhini]RNE98191.1 hypothetical protein Tco025E_09276 [Trypanosoma conorhini]
MRGTRCYLQSCVRGGGLGQHAEALFRLRPDTLGPPPDSGKVAQAWVPLARTIAAEPLDAANARMYLDTSPLGGLDADADPEERYKGCMLRVESKARAPTHSMGGRLRGARSAVWLRRPLVWVPGTRPCSVKCGGGSLACGCRAECQTMEQVPAELLPRVPATSGRRAAAVFTDFLSLLGATETGPTRVTDGGSAAFGASLLARSVVARAPAL